MCISSKKGPSLSTQTYFSGRILCKRKHDLIFFLYKNDAKKKSRREEKKRNNPRGYLGQANGKTIMRKNGRGVFVGYVWGGCHSTWLHCEFLSLYKNLSLSLSPCLSPFFLSIIRSVRRRKALNKQPVELSQLEPFSIITSSTILNLHCFI